MDQEILHKFSYGLFILTTNDNDRDNGCIIDTVIQSSSDPVTVSISVNKKSLTCEMLQKSGRYTLSVIGKDANMELFRHWGYQSGHNVDKLKNYTDIKKTANGTLAITRDTSAYLSVNVTKQIDLGSHILFIGTLVDGEVLNDALPMTYAYYTDQLK